MAERRVYKIFHPGELPQLYRRVGIYCRVSSSGTAQLNSMSQQVSYLTQLVSGRRDWELRDTYLDFESGARAQNRSGYQRMLRDCRNGKLDIILTRNISRFGRDAEEILKQLRQLKACNVEVRFVQEDLSSSCAENDLMISIIASLAQADNTSRRQNIIWGIQRQLENGTSSIYSRPCYGYCKDAHGELTIDIQQARTVELIFQLYLSGCSILQIIKELKKLGIKSPSGKDQWCKRSLENMLCNEKYCGNVLVVKTYQTESDHTKRVRNRGERKKYYVVGNHPAIISKEDFDKVQMERERRSNIEETPEGSKRKSTHYSSKSKNIQ